MSARRVIPAKGVRVSQPNIVLIIADHFRPDFITPAYTPNLTALAADGVCFASAYCAAPLCQPSRNCIITGQFPSQHGVCGNQTPPIMAQLRDDTFMSRLQRGGYHTALVGKHHYIDRYGIGMDITDDDEELKSYGFDDVLQVCDDGENQHNDDRYTQYLASNGMLETFRSEYKTGTAAYRHPFEADDTADGFIGRKGIDFVRNWSGEGPFYLNIGFIGPHPPYWHPGELEFDPQEMTPPLGVPDSANTRERRAHFAQKCRLIDRYVGDLRTALAEKKLAENTVIIFTSDHGDCLGDFGIWDKRFFYEQSVGVPLIMAGPGVPRGERMNGPRVCRHLVSHVDLYPTITALAGADEGPPPADSSPRLDRRAGMDLRAAFDATGPDLRRAVFAELGTAVMVRTAGWKLVYDAEQGGVSYLYNLRNDPHELHNLAGVAGYEAVSAELVETILSHRIGLTQFTHAKEEQRFQRVRAG